MLYNDSPLVITNLNLTTFPPSVIYIHGQTPAVPLKFKVNNPPYWNAGDIFGYLVLAGHGTITNDCNSPNGQGPLLDAVLGPIGTSSSSCQFVSVSLTTITVAPASSRPAVFCSEIDPPPITTQRRLRRSRKTGRWPPGPSSIVVLTIAWAIVVPTIWLLVMLRAALQHPATPSLR